MNWGLYVLLLNQVQFQKKHCTGNNIVDSGHDRMIKNNAFQKFIKETVHLS